MDATIVSSSHHPTIPSSHPIILSSQVAANREMDVFELIALNAPTFPQISARSKVRPFNGPMYRFRVPQGTRHLSAGLTHRRDDGSPIVGLMARSRRDDGMMG